MGRVIHFEIPAVNPERLVNFYKTVFGWKIEKYEPINYWLATTGENSEPGINGAITEKDETHPVTINTIGVPSFEDAVSKIAASGGQILMPKTTVLGVGYMTYCKDLEGNIFGIMQNDPNAK